MQGNAENIRALIEYLETVPDESFNMNVWASPECGCIAWHSYRMVYGKPDILPDGGDLVGHLADMLGIRYNYAEDLCIAGWAFLGMEDVSLVGDDLMHVTKRDAIEALTRLLDMVEDE